MGLGPKGSADFHSLVLAKLLSTWHQMRSCRMQKIECYSPQQYSAAAEQVTAVNSAMWALLTFCFHFLGGIGCVLN